MTVRADKTDVLYSVVVSDPIDVIEMQRQLLSKPFSDATTRTLVFKKPFLEQTLLEMVARSVRAVLDKDVFEWVLLGPRATLPL